MSSVLKNNAGIARVQAPAEISESDWDEILDVNLKSAFYLSAAVAKPRAGGG